jgi:hypothetical protein
MKDSRSFRMAVLLRRSPPRSTPRTRPHFLGQVAKPNQRNLEDAADSPAAVYPSTAAILQITPFPFLA